MGCATDDIRPARAEAAVADEVALAVADDGSFSAVVAAASTGCAEPWCAVPPGMATAARCAPAATSASVAAIASVTLAASVVVGDCVVAVAVAVAVALPAA